MERELSAEEIVYIAKNYGNLGPVKIGEELGVSKQKVATMASRLRKSGIDVPKRMPKGDSFKEVVEILKEGEKFNLFK